MLRRLAVAGMVLAVAACSTGPQEVPLVTGRAMTPQESTGEDLGSFPVNLALSPDGKFAVTTDAGYRQALHVLRMSDGKSVGQVEYSNKRGAGATVGEASPEVVAKTNGLYFGVAIDTDNNVYAAQGAADAIAVLKLSETGLTPRGKLATRKDDCPAGLALDGRGLLYVANQSAPSRVSNPFEIPGSIAIYSCKMGTEVGRYSFSESYFGTSNFPLAIGVLRDGSKLYVASERDGAVYVLDVTTAATPRLLRKVEVGSHPSALLFTKDQSRLYVANADSDTVSVIDCRSDAVTGTIALRPDAARTLPGASPVALALSPDEETLYVALADMNAVAIVDVDAAAVRGYVATGWYPTALAARADGKSLLVLNAKGTKARVPGPAKHESPLNLLEGNAQLLSLPDAKGLPDATAQVLSNNHFSRLNKAVPEPLSAITRKSAKITHVIYVIKENRTYDQVLGDMPTGNGDKTLCLFPREITPNQHALAERFGLMDNLYACGEVSGDGWDWSTESMANPYVARNIPYHYSQRGRHFDFEGQNNGYVTGGHPAVDADGKLVATNSAFKNGAQPIPDVAEAAGGHLWDMCTKHGVSFRNYGFFCASAGGVIGMIDGADNYPTAAGLQPGGHDLAGLTDLDFRRFDLDYPDSDGPALLAKQTGDATYLFDTTAYGKAKSPSRIAEFRREFEMMLAKDATGGAVPSLIMLRLPTDHTLGAKAGKHTPTAFVADNDYAVGQLVELISHSPIWEHTAIFVIEDDAQSGSDHVDCHRTTGFVISPYLARAKVDHRFYNTNSLLRTMEILLDLPPMTQYDGTATIVSGWTRTPENREAYEAMMPGKQFFAQRTPAAKDRGVSAATAKLVTASEQMDFSHEDAAPAQELNEIIWKMVRGVDSEMPAPRAGLLFPDRKVRDDDDD